MSLLLFLAAAAVAPSAKPDPTIVVVPVAAPADPAKLAVARDIARRLLPEGTFERMMSSVMNGTMKSITDGMMSMPLKSLAGMGGVDAAKLKDLGPGSMKQMMAILDPAFDRRMALTTQVMGVEMGRFMSTMEPEMREGLAETYANRFSPAQLADVDAFFKTPSGSAFAAQMMTAQTDPAFMARMQQMIPKLMQAMPGIMGKVQAATADLPKARKFDELSPAEKADLSKLMGIDPAKVKP